MTERHREIFYNNKFSINTSNLIEAINDPFENSTQNIIELNEQAAAVANETKDDKLEQELQNLNISQSSTREKLDNIEDDEEFEMNSRLNPEAKEFVPIFSPPSATGDSANEFGSNGPIPQHFKEELISQSPRKGRELNMKDINIPADNEFDQEIAHKPHGLPGDEIIIEPAENGCGLFQEMNWKEAMHGSEKEEGPLIDSPEVVDNIAAPNVCELSAPVDLENAGMKQSIYIENNKSNDEFNTVQLLPQEEIESENTSSDREEEKDVISKEGVKEILKLASDKEIIESRNQEAIEQKSEQMLLSHDKEFTKDVQMEIETVPINGVKMAPEDIPTGELLVPIAEPVIEQTPEPTAPAAEFASIVSVAQVAQEGLILDAAVATVVAVTDAAAVKKVEAEKNQKNLRKTSSATKSKVPDTKKPAVGAAAKTSTVSSIAAKRTLAE